MTTYYGVLRPVTAEDLEAHPKFADVPGLIPPDGTSPSRRSGASGQNTLRTASPAAFAA